MRIDMLNDKLSRIRNAQLDATRYFYGTGSLNKAGRIFVIEVSDGSELPRGQCCLHSDIDLLIVLNNSYI